MMFTAFLAPHTNSGGSQTSNKPHTHEAEKGAVPRQGEGDPAGTNPLLWRAADRVTTRKHVRQNSVVLQVYFDIGLFGGLEMSNSGCRKHQNASILPDDF